MPEALLECYTESLFPLIKNYSQKLRSKAMVNYHLPTRAASRIVSVSVILLLLSVVANAYTVIMHGGRRIEIPSRFVVTPATLTYQVTEGIQITIPMAAIDIPATEKANNEPPGSLLKRAQLATEKSFVSRDLIQKQKADSGSRRTITNRDLEASMLRRRENEAAYEARRKQLGLPSLEESRKRAAAEFDLVTTELAQKRIAERKSEDYWRARADALRTEIAALDAELNYIRTRLDEVPFATPFGVLGGSFTSFGSIVGFGNFRGSGNFGGSGSWGGRPFGNFGGGRSFRGQMRQRPNVYVAPPSGPQLRARVGFGGGATRSQVFVNPGNFGHVGQIGIGAPFGILPNTVFGSTVQGYDFTYERSALITRFNELAAARAGLSARWRELEDEARRAGVAPGWLRP